MKFLKFIAISIFCLFPTLKDSIGQTSKPNILFIFADDHAYQAVSAYGHNLNYTPNIDRLAEEGIRFDRCFVTNSICGPSRATILTGKYSHLNGFYRNVNPNNQFDGTQQTFPKILQKNGYKTALLGKWHLGSEPTGFDDWEVMIGQGFYYNPSFLSKTGLDTVTGYSVDIVADKAINWMTKNDKKEEPFMLMVQFKAPHREWEPGPKYLNRYDDHIFPEPPTLFDNYEGRASAVRNQKMTIAHHMHLKGDNKLYNEESKMNPLGRSYSRMNDTQRYIWDEAYQNKNDEFYALNLSKDDLTRWKYQRYMQDYMSVIASVDENVGRILDYLDHSGLSENTIVFYCSDQGFYLGEHGWFDKRWMYEQSFRTPLLIRWPGKVSAGSVCRDIVSNLDFAETFLDIAGVPIPADMQGRSLIPILLGQTPNDWRTSFYYRYYEGGGHGVPEHEGVYLDSMKLIHYYTLNEWEMFDLKRDPHELRSVIDNPEYHARKQLLEKELSKKRSILKVDEE